MEEKKSSYQIGKQVLTEDDLKFPVEYKGEVFTLWYPNPQQRSIIETEITRRLGGVPREACSMEMVGLTTACAYVDNLMVPNESPTWFTSAWTCYDEELIATLYAGYLTFRDKIQTKIRDGEFERGSEGGTS